MAGSAEETAPATGAAEANTPAAGVNSAGALAGLEALVLQQSAMMNQMTPKVNELSDRVAASEEASAKAVAQASGSAQSGDAELEAPRKLPVNNRYTMIQLRAGMESDATIHGGAEALRAKLSFVEEKVYAGTEGLVTDSVLTKWLKEFDTTKAKAVMYTHAKASAKTSTFRDRQGGGKGKGAGKGEGSRGSGKGGKGIGAGPPQLFDHGVSLVDATSSQLEWMRAETERCLHTGAWVRAHRRRHVSRVFLVPKLRTIKWRLVMDFRWLNAHCLKSRCKTETLKKLRRLAKPDDWCFSFDLQDGYHLVGIDKDFQEYMQFDSAEDHREVRKLRNGSKAYKRWAACTRLEDAGEKSTSLPYMDDFLVLTSSKVEALRARELASRVLTRLGIGRNEKKGQWEPTQLVEHLGLEVDLAAGQFRVTLARLHKIHGQVRALLSEASRQRRWLPARWLAGFTGLCQSVCAVPPARLYLRELYFVLSIKRGWGSKGDELRHLHITHLELEAVYKTVQSFLRELTGKVVRLYCDNHAVVAMLSHFTSRDPELMRRMRRLWLLLDLNDIELQWADTEWHNHTVYRFASELSTQLPRYYAQWYDSGCEGVDSLAYSWLGEINWVNPPWSSLDELAHKLREEGGGPVLAGANVVPSFGSTVRGDRHHAAAARPLHSKSVGRVQAARSLRPRRSCVSHSLLPVSYDVQGARKAVAAKPQPKLAPGSRVEVYWPIDDAWYPGEVGDTDEYQMTQVAYDDRDVEMLDMRTERYRVVPPAKGERVDEWDMALEERWRDELGRSWLPATEATVPLYFAHLMSKETIKAASLQPYLSAINNYHEDMGYDGPSKGRSMSRAVKGMASLQVKAAETQEEGETVRSWLPARHVSKVHAHGLAMRPTGRAEMELLRACTYVVFAFVTFGRPNTGVSMQKSHIAVADDVISVVLQKEKGRRHVRLKRRLTSRGEGLGAAAGALAAGQGQLVAANILVEQRGETGTATGGCLGSRGA
eukprot:gene34200-biopygen19794